MIFTKAVSSFTYILFDSKRFKGTNNGHPEAMFISETGLLKEDKLGSGAKMQNTFLSNIPIFPKSVINGT